jgi:anti-sigma regulatory factor (Ser/Thr protein kinase)
MVDNVFTKSDEIRIKQIILNFISNSVKFTDEGRIELKCILERIDEHNFVKISVIDTGLGIKKEDIDKLFMEYVQLDEDSIKNNKLGSGLGLSICKNISDKLNCKIGVKSEYKIKTEFYLMIPIKENEIFVPIFEEEEINNNSSFKFKIPPIKKENINNLNINNEIINEINKVEETKDTINSNENNINNNNNLNNIINNNQIVRSNTGKQSKSNSNLYLIKINKTLEKANTFNPGNKLNYEKLFNYRNNLKYEFDSEHVRFYIKYY